MKGTDLVAYFDGIDDWIMGYPLLTNTKFNLIILIFIFYNYFWREGFINGITVEFWQKFDVKEMNAHVESCFVSHGSWKERLFICFPSQNIKIIWKK